LKLVNYRRKIPSSTSTDSVLGIRTPDSDSSSSNFSLQNEELVQEAIYALTGKSGKFLKKDVTGEFKLDIKAPNLNAQDAISLIRLGEIGQLHNEIKKFTDSNSEFFLCGLFGQGLISQLENELVQFYGLVAHLQDNVIVCSLIHYTNILSNLLLLILASFSTRHVQCKRSREDRANDTCSAFFYPQRTTQQNENHQGNLANLQKSQRRTACVSTL
jgi:Gamma tubulin complex component N-terminal